MVQPIPSGSANRYICTHLLKKGIVCGFPFKTSYHLKWNLTRVHAEDILKVECDLCGKGFKTAEDSKNHKRKVHKK